MTKYLFCDAEMGGRDIKFSLLSVYFLVTDECFNKIDDLLLNVKPDDGVYILSGQGMGVNGIDIAEHDRIAIPYKEAKSLLYNFLKRNCVAEHKIETQRLIPVGHGVKGDIAHITKNIISEGSWEQYCTHHYIDTGVVLQFLRLCEKIHPDCDGSVSGIVKYFNPNKSLNEIVPGTLHDPKVDALFTVQALKEFKILIQFPRSSGLGWS